MARSVEASCNRRGSARFSVGADEPGSSASSWSVKTVSMPATSQYSAGWQGDRHRTVKRPAPTRRRCRHRRSAVGQEDGPQHASAPSDELLQPLQRREFQMRHRAAGSGARGVRRRPGSRRPRSRRRQGPPHPGSRSRDGGAAGDRERVEVELGTVAERIALSGGVVSEDRGGWPGGSPPWRRVDLR